MSEKLNILFTHPLNSKTFTAKVSPRCTGQIAIDGLLSNDNREPFLDPPPPGRAYELIIRRLNEPLDPNMSFEQAGVIDTDVIEVRISTTWRRDGKFREPRRGTNKIEVLFEHPRSVQTFKAEISTSLTGQQAIELLLAGNEEGPFLDPAPPGRAYELVVERTYQAIIPSKTFEEAGVEDGDIIEIRILGQGAGPDWSELGQMLFWSATAASIFLRAAVPIFVEFLKNKSSRSIIVRKGDIEIIITGDETEKAKDILKLLKDQPITAGQQAVIDEDDKRLDSPISITLRDSK